MYCRSDEANEDFYVFTIDTDGFHAIGKVVDGEPSRLWAGVEPSPAIRGLGNFVGGWLGGLLPDTAASKGMK